VNAGLVTVLHSPPYGIHLTKKGYELWYAPIKRLEEERTARAKATADAKLLRAAEAAVEAKAEAEANPDDPLSWLRMAEAMDAANRHEEAERCRKTAMELMEK
jgi:predicted adenine nucleotide alpha hydrolase (AANH) superfamily ATPase